MAVRDLTGPTSAPDAAAHGRKLGSLGAFCGIVGALTALLANAAYPRPAQWDRPEPLLTLIAQTGREAWLLIHIGMLFGALLIFGAFVALSRTVAAPGASALAQLGVAAAGVATAIWAVLAATDGAAMKTLADLWAASPDAHKAEALRVAHAVAALNGTLFSAGIVVGFGVAFPVFGLAVALDESGPTWLGWIAVPAGVVALAIGVWQWYAGSSVLLTNQLFPLVAFVLLAWVLVTSVVLWLTSTE